ncbi:MAG: hypothetical protein WCV67_10990 [Victivallaceae bacterium]|jgi:hypothetical protein
MLTIENADEYFSRHLLQRQWSALSAEQKDAALKMASDDICGRLKISELDETCVFQLCAAYEQAVFLGSNIDNLIAGTEILSENIEGVGGRTYQTKTDSGFSPRALLFLERISVASPVTQLGRG